MEDVIGYILELSKHFPSVNKEIHETTLPVWRMVY
jgi:hypothetical protein